MSSFPPTLESWVILVALLWLASIVLLGVAMRRYVVSRAFFDARAARLFVKEPFLPAPAASDAVTQALPEGTEGEVDAASIPQRSARDIVRERVARDRTSAQGLVELVRALYLDGSSFEFSTIAELDPDDRALAKALIDEWLANPSATDDWKSAYDAVREINAVRAG